MSKLSAALVRVVFGISLCAGMSFALAQLFAGSALRTALPLCYIVVLWVLGWRYGIAVGVIGSLVCAFIFAHFLFEPTGSWHVQDAVARRNLLWMVLGGVSLSYLFAPAESPRNRP